MQDENARNPDSMPTMPPRETPRGPAADSMPTMDPRWREQGEWGGRRWQPGEEILDRYVVEKELGRGGMGVVYGCLDKVGGVRVAVKALPPEVAHDRVEMEEIRKNFRLVGGLRHPNIAGVRNLEQDGRGECFLVMDVAEGESLREWFARKAAGGGVPLAEVVPILRQVAAALDYAHSERIVHRDVKPGNVMVDAQGRVRVLDFGLASQIQSSLSRVSRDTGDTGGTRSYMAPEQWEGRKQDAKTDQYALAAMAYELLSGGLPFENNDVDVMRRAVLNSGIEDIPGLPASAMAALRRAMAKTRAERFGTCGEFVAALAGGGRRPRGKTAAGWLAALLVVASVAGGAWWWQGRPAAALQEGPAAGGTPALPGDDAAVQRQLEEARQRAEAAEKERKAAEQKQRELEDRLARVEQQQQKQAKAIAAGGTPALPREGRWAGDVRTIALPGGATMEMVWCPPGEFTMGSPAGEEGRFDNETQHGVTLTKGFWLAKTEVTQKQWQSVMGNNPSRWKGDDLPVECVSWDECQEFCKKMGFRLPTAAEWEYACRAGSTTALPNGEIRILGQNNAPDLDPIAWYSGNSSVGWSGSDGRDTSNWSNKQYPGGNAGTHPVGRKKANAWGLHDMIGNVWEWCADWYGRDLGSAAVTDPKGPGSGSDRVIRGGSWYIIARTCRSATRSSFSPHGCCDDLGFRPAKDSIP